MYMNICMHVYMCTICIPLCMLRQEEGVGDMVWVLGTEPSSSERAADALNC